LADADKLISQRSMKESTDIEYLENFILSNPELDKLENLLSEFNIFETLNLEHVEIRHSNILAWLLNPNENHGLSSYFLRQFLKFIVSANRSYFETSNLSLFDFELFKYRNVEVRREWNNIDILISISEDDKKLVVAIENKIKTSEHSGQLQRYRSIIGKEFKDFTQLYIFLTPENIIPSDDAWIPFNYDIVADLLDDLIKYKKSILHPNIHSFILQYQIILRRYIVGSSEVEKIAKEIYKKHKRALDIIFQYKPDIYSDISGYLQGKLKDQKNIIFDSSAKTLIRFTTTEIDTKVEQIGEGWTKSKRILLFEFSLYDFRVVLRLIIGPGDSDSRKEFHDFFLKDKKIFKLADRKVGTKFYTVYQKEFLHKRDFEDDDSEVMQKKLEKKFNEFIDNDLQSIHTHFQNHWN
jgi:hypothetical protein